MMDLSFGFLSFREKVVIINMMNGYSDKLIFELLILQGNFQCGLEEFILK